MTTKTRHCDQCQNLDVSLKAELENRVCRQGHKPRFYGAQEVSRAGGWGGWKRRCEDFKERENGHPARHD